MAAKRQVRVSLRIAGGIGGLILIAWLLLPEGSELAQTVWLVLFFGGMGFLLFLGYLVHIGRQDAGLLNRE